MKQVTAIGIDLGTTNSCVAVVRNGHVDAVANKNGNRTTPSCVAFKGNTILIGDSAKEQAGTNVANTVYSVKRMIGQRYCEINRDTVYWPFRIKEDDNKRPQIEVDFENERRLYSPEMISSKVLAHMKEIAETALSHKVADAVISVPAYFNNSQRQATTYAATLAGLNVLRIINEPTAAAIDYGLYATVKRAGKLNVLVFDFGGGTFDVSVLTMNGSKYTVRATTGAKHLGGDDIDQKLFEHCAAEFRKKGIQNITSDEGARHRLLVACEKAKRTLSIELQANITVPCEGAEHTIQLSRLVLDRLCSGLFKKTMELVELALSEAKLTKEQIDDIVLVGGSTRIPKIQKMLSRFFNDKKLNSSVNPDEVVARGAALEAAILAGQISTIMELTDVAPISLGVEEIGGVMRKIIPANTQIPCKRTKEFARVGVDETELNIMVFQGESDYTAKNHQLGSLCITGFLPVEKDVNGGIDITFSIDANGIVSVSTVDKSNNAKEGKLTIKEPAVAVIKVEDLKRMVEEGDRQAALLDCRKKLESYLSDCRDEIIRLTQENKISSEDSAAFNMKAEQVELLLSTYSAEEEDYQRTQGELENMCRGIRERAQHYVGSLVGQIRRLFF